MAACAAVTTMLAIGGITAAAGAHARTPSLPFYVTADRTPVWTGSPAHRVADWSLTDQDSHRVSANDLDGQIYVASFFFTTCRGYCPTLRTNLAKVAEAFVGDSRVAILSYAAIPELDDVARLAEYGRVNHIHAPQWRLLTGPRPEITRLAHESYFIELSDTSGNAGQPMVHTEAFVLVDGTRRIRGIYDGTLAYDVAQMIADIHTLEHER